MENDFLEEIYSRPLLIVCDTCTFAADFTLKNTFWKKIKSILANHPNVIFYLPSAIEKEVEKKILDMGKMDLDNLKERANKFSVNELSSFLDFPVMEIGLDKYVRTYKTKVLKPFFGTKLKRSPFPAVQASEYFNRSVSQKKPFKTENTKGGYRKAVDGFRDAVIWESVKELYAINQTANLLFITLNSKDFSGEMPNILHSDFSDDLKAIKDGTHEIHYLSSEESLGAFVQKVELADKASASMKTLILKKLKGSNESDIIKAVEEYSNEASEFDFDRDDGEITYAEVDSVDIDTFYKQDGEKSLLVEGHATVMGKYEFFLDKSVDHSSSKLKREGIEIEDSNWNDHVMLCSQEFTFHLHFIASTQFNTKGEPSFEVGESLFLNGINIEV